MSNMSIKEVLIHAKSLIDTPEKWTQGVRFRDEQGYACNMHKAVSYCSIGALCKADAVNYRSIEDLCKPASDIDICKYAKYLSRAIKMLDHDLSVFVYNDTFTHEEVMKVWDLAIKLAGDEVG